MFRSKTHHLVLILALGIVGGLLMILPAPAEAGIFNASSQVTYKEYWVNHSQFTGGCNDDGTPTNPGGTWYVEPWTLQKCPKTLAFQLPDDFSNALKIELYLDLWRAYSPGSLQFRLNNNPTIYTSPVGNDWSRSPWVLEVDKADLKTGANTLTVWAARPTHIHDIGIRIYHNNDNPLLPAPGSDVEPPTGQITSIADDNGPVSPDAGGTLTVNNDKLTLTADVSADTLYVEFHAWYEGYDEDNDGVFRDWHNSGRNNWWPGGKEEQLTGGTINHIGTVKPKNGVATVTWNIGHITNQPLIKFKLRVVDAAGNVREGAGGISADFKLMRNVPVNAFIIHGFTDFGLHMDGKRPDSVSYDMTLPDTVATYFTNATLIGAYWRNPNVSINAGPAMSVAATDWALGIKPFTKGYLVPGLNRFTFLWANGSGHFIEYPGPMVVLRRTTPTTADTTPPAVSGQLPAPNATNVAVKSAIVARLGDTQFGVDWTTIKVFINGEDRTNQTDIQGVMGDYRLVYDPPGNLAFSTEYNIRIEACDLLGNCMNPVSYKFTTAAPDTTAPVISNVVVTTLPNGANINWTTNEPATSRVEYGKTTNYELGAVEDLTLKVTHAVEIRGLQPSTRYHFRIRGADEQGNVASTNDDTFVTTEFGDILSDDFNACQLNSMWTEIDPQGNTTLKMSGETLTMSFPAGGAHDWTTGGPPRIVQAANNNDFTVEVKFESPLTAVGQMQGILIEEDADTYIRVAFERTATGFIMFSRFVNNGTVVKSATTSFTEGTTLPTMLRVRRIGDSFARFYYQDGQWKGQAAYTMAITPIQIGVFAGAAATSGAAPAHTVVVDYFFNSDLPIIPEDANPMAVNVTVVGNGTVTKDPDKSSYTCGESVALAATTIPGWSFAGWSGDINASTPNTSVTIDGPKSVVATFTQDQYLLNVNIDNDGIGGDANAVTRSPDKATYVYGDVVELTAVPQPGWTFTGWTGAVNSTSPTVSLTMFSTQTVTAHFKQDTYSLTLNTIHNGNGTGGTATVTPQKSAYLYGDVVTLRATPNAGWTFTGWSGAVTSTELETQLTITNDTVVNATFTQDQYKINVKVTSIGKEGVGGTVSLNPNRATYVYNDQVALVAQANSCWSFDHWEGDLSGNNQVELLTVTRNMDVTAVFTQNRHTLTINKTGPGNVVVAPNLAEYYCGDQVTLTAVPAQNYFFTGWSGDLTGAENPATMTIEKNTIIRATFSNNPPPTVDAIADQTVPITELLTFDVHASDPTGQPVTLSATDLPPGATFVDKGNGTGTFTWRPNVSQNGEYVVTFIASDGEGQGSQTVTITVEGHAVVLPMIIR